MHRSTRYLSVRLFVLAIAAITCVGLSAPLFAGEHPTATKPGMAKFLVESPHTPEECLAALDKMAVTPGTLAKFDWGCMAGDHTGYAIVDAANESAALESIPASMRSGAKAIKLNKFTPEQIKAFHQK